MYIYIFQLKVLEKQENNLNKTLDKVLEIGENATEQEVAKECNEVADKIEKNFDKVSKKINEKRAEAGL